VNGSSIDLARTVMQRFDALAKISDDPHCLTRVFCSPAMRRANALVASWMREAGMYVRTDAIGNLIGHYPAKSKIKYRKSKILILGSHLDTVRNAGKFDGSLGVLVAIACVQQLHVRRTCIPFDIEVVGFADEEGVRYQSTYLGSRVLAGTFDLKDLNRLDADGIRMARAIRDFGGKPSALLKAKVDPKRLLGYVEVHIEQGPVLEKENLSVGVVSAIAGQTRMRISFIGHAGHAGTTPMNLRRDALCAAAEFISTVESFARSRRRNQADSGLVATIGQITALPGVSNVIPGEVTLSLDVRHAKDSVRRQAVTTLKQRASEITRQRKLKLSVEVVHESAAIECDKGVSSLLTESAMTYQMRVPILPSGAGHDAAAMAAIAPVGMLFVRCKSGLSHHPDESASEKDISVALSAMNDFLQLLSQNG
jgi:allantoate deiminase